MPMASTDVFPKKTQAVRKKSETGGLFQEICKHYDPFHRCFLPFPLSVIAQARAWRGHTPPDETLLETSLTALVKKELDEGYIKLLMAYCESAFRPIRAAELALEKLLPGMLFTRSTYWPPSSEGFVLLESDFWNQLKVLEGKSWKRWVLAAGSVPLNIHGRPPLVAPWIVGATIKRWLAIKKVSDTEAEALALDLASVLLGRGIRPEELRHWESLLNTVAVTLDDKTKVLLPGYLIDIGQRMKPNEMGWGGTVGTNWGPKDFLKSVPLDEAACEELAKAIQKGWKRPTKPTLSRTRKPQNGVTLEPSVEPEIPMHATCDLCSKTIELHNAYKHLEEAHGISHDEIEADPSRHELRRVGTQEVLLRYKG